jgi:hypothetical protein
MILLMTVFWENETESNFHHFSWQTWTVNDCLSRPGVKLQLFITQTRSQFKIWPCDTRYQRAVSMTLSRRSVSATQWLTEQEVECQKYLQKLMIVTTPSDPHQSASDIRTTPRKLYSTCLSSNCKKRLENLDFKGISQDENHCWQMLTGIVISSSASNGQWWWNEVLPDKNESTFLQRNLGVRSHVSAAWSFMQDNASCH